MTTARVIALIVLALATVLLAWRYLELTVQQTGFVIVAPVLIILGVIYLALIRK